MKPLQNLAIKASSVFALLLFSAQLVSCDDSNNPNLVSLAGAGNGCAPGTAELAVGDGFQEIFCGCNEPGGTVSPSGSTPAVTCTVPVGTEILFYYIGTRLLHQIVPTVGSVFAASPLSDPALKVPVTVYGFQLTAAGTYGYVDAFDGGITGRLIAQ
jgi:hypothetical protein